MDVVNSWHQLGKRNFYLIQNHRELLSHSISLAKNFTLSDLRLGQTWRV